MYKQEERSINGSTPKNEVMTVDDVAEFLRLDRKTVYDLIQRKEIKGWKRVGRQIRFSRKAFMKWFEG